MNPIFSSDKWGANEKAIDFKYTWYKQSGGAVGYIMNYITKTFKDEANLKTQHAVYWYIKYKVRRFLSSRTLAPLSIYRKIRYFFKDKDDDFNIITKKLSHGVIKKCFDDTQILYIYYNHDLGEVEEKILWSKNADLILNARKEKELEAIGSQKQRESIKYTKPQPKEPETIYEKQGDRYIYSYTKGQFIKLPVVVSKLKNYSLVGYFRKLDNMPLDELNIQHYLLTKNEIIKRGLLKGDLQPLNDTTSEYGF